MGIWTTCGELTSLQMPPPPRNPSAPLLPAQRLQFAAAYSVLEQAVSRAGFSRAQPSACSQEARCWRSMALAASPTTRRRRLSPLPPSTTWPASPRSSLPLPWPCCSIRREQLVLDQPLVQILPAFAQGEAAGGARHQVTLRMLLAHASGLPGYARLFETACGPGGAARCLPPPAPRSRAGKPCRVLRSGIHSARARRSR